MGKIKSLILLLLKLILTSLMKNHRSFSLSMPKLNNQSLGYIEAHGDFNKPLKTACYLYQTTM